MNSDGTNEKIIHLMPLLTCLLLNPSTERSGKQKYGTIFIQAFYFINLSFVFYLDKIFLKYCQT